MKITDSGESEGVANETATTIFDGSSTAILRVQKLIRGVSKLRVTVLFGGAQGSGKLRAFNGLCDAADVDSNRVLVVRHKQRNIPARSCAGKFVLLQRVDEFDLEQQVEWLRRLDDAEAGRKGAPERVAATTRADLTLMAQEGLVHRGLASRLCRFTISIPSLSSRGDDFRVLAKLMSDDARDTFKKSVKLSDRAIAKLRRRPWPGNVRELREAVEKLVAFAEGSSIGVRTIDEILPLRACEIDRLRQNAKRTQKDELIALLKRHRGNISEVARQLGLSRGAVVYRAQQHGLMRRSG